MKRNVLLAILILVSSTVYAGGPFTVTSSGVATSWSLPIVLNPESGSCGSFNNTQMLAKLETNLDYWSGNNITGMPTSFFDVGSGLGEDVDSTNYSTYVVLSSSSPGVSDDLNPVIFDDNGAITVALFGSSARFTTLGFAGPHTFSGSTITGGQAVFNCRCQTGNTACPGGITFTEDDINFTIMHESGHLAGLDHTQVNQDTAGVVANTSTSDCSTSVSGDCDVLPAMFPQSVDPADQITPQRDDEVAMLSLYASTYLTNNFCTVTGTLLDANGDPLRCADVQASTTSSADTIASVSGTYASNQDTNGDGYTDGSGECLSNCGDFTLRGLDSTKTYTITVKPIDSAWVSGSGINPCTNGQLEDVEEEVIGTIDPSDCASRSVSLGSITTRSLSSTGGGTGTGSSASSGCALAYPTPISRLSGMMMGCFILAIGWWRLRASA